jgi:hypothetical protein
MKLTQALATAVTALAIGVPVAGATPDGYQPQLKSASQSDAFMRYLRSNTPTSQSDAFARYLRNNAPQTGAASHPDSQGVRFSLAVSSTPESVGIAEGRDLTTGVVGALLGAFSAVLAIATASAIRGRRRVAEAS